MRRLLLNIINAPRLRSRIAVVKTVAIMILGRRPNEFNFVMFFLVDGNTFEGFL
jgi:hypothetical protein